jgi:cyclopropane-fatty-acyl-phospholipid synthase
VTGVAHRVAAVAERLVGGPLPIRIRAWDGSETGPPGTPALWIRHRRALRRIMWQPGELGLARAWVAGELDVEGDLYEALDALAELIWEKSDDAPGPRGVLSLVRDPAMRAAARELLALGGPLPPPPPPREENRRRKGIRHTLLRDREAISHHYDVGNDFYELVLGPSMVYSCAYWEPGGSLEDAQRSKLDLICRKLALREGQRMLDVGCGWGSLALHAAREYGVRVVGVTLSHEQATYARKRVAEAGLTEQIEIRVQDYREIPDGPYDAIASVGMAEHVGRVRYREYADDLYKLLVPGGRLLNHQIGRRPLKDESAYQTDEFIDAYVFPDGELAPVGTTVGLLEDAGFEVRDVEAIREHYALTLRAWVANLEAGFARASRLSTPARARVWRLYMAASALSFERNKIGVNQVLAVRTPGSGVSGMPLRAREWRAD